MKRLWSCLVLAIALGSAELSAQTPGDAQDVVILLPRRPLLVRFHLQVDGQPLQKAWAGFIQFLFQEHDTDQDGALSVKEQRRLPDPITLFQLTDADDGSPRELKLPKRARLQELLSSYVQRGAKPFRPAPRNPEQFMTTEALNFALLVRLDGNNDGSLSRDELQRAEQVLFSSDFNEDEVVQLHEVFGQPDASTGAILVNGRSFPNDAPASQVIVVQNQKDNALLAQALLER